MKRKSTCIFYSLKYLNIPLLMAILTGIHQDIYYNDIVLLYLVSDVYWYSGLIIYYLL